MSAASSRCGSVSGSIRFSVSPMWISLNTRPSRGCGCRRTLILADQPSASVDRERDSHQRDLVGVPTLGRLLGGCEPIAARSPHPHPRCRHARSDATDSRPSTARLGAGGHVLDEAAAVLTDRERSQCVGSRWCLCWGREAKPHRLSARLAAGSDVELCQDRRDVMIDRLLRHDQALGDLRVAQPLGEQREHF